MNTNFWKIDMKVSPVSLMAAALSASFAPPVREDQATRLARMMGQSPEDVRAELNRLGYSDTRVPDALPPRKADPVRKKERKSARDARKRNRK
jgi:hypothetical protein